MDSMDARLTPKQFALLFTLIQNEGREVSATELYETVWNMSANGDARAIKSTFHNYGESCLSMKIVRLKSQQTTGMDTVVIDWKTNCNGILFGYSLIEEYL